MSSNLRGVNQGPFGSLVREQFGINNGDPNELFSEPGLVALREALMQYRAAGATIGGSPTFRLTDFRVNRNGGNGAQWELASRPLALTPVTLHRNQIAVALAQEVFDERPVVGLIAPITDTSGADDSQWKDIEGRQVEWVMQRQRPQVEALIQAGVSAIWAEAVRYRNEAIALARTVRECSGKTLVVSFEANEQGFPDPAGSGTYLFKNMKQDLEGELKGTGVEVLVGANCTGITTIKQILSRGDRLDVAYPNSLDFGSLRAPEKAIYAMLVEDPNRSKLAEMILSVMHDHLQTTPEQFEEAWKLCLETGARVIGVCCGGTPDLVARARVVYDRVRPGELR